MVDKEEQNPKEMSLVEWLVWYGKRHPEGFNLPENDPGTAIEPAWAFEKPADPGLKTGKEKKGKRLNDDMAELVENEREPNFDDLDESENYWNK